MSNKRIAQVVLAGFYILCLSLPVYFFFNERGGAGFLEGASLNALLKLFFPLLGLYAFTFVTFQILIASNIRWLRRVWPGILRFHRAEGSFALLFALLHPGFIALGYGIAKYLSFTYVAPGQVGWLLPAYVALVILLMTAGTAFLAWRGKDIPWWRKLHKLNYLVFALVWIHSWFIGTDTQSAVVRSVWLAYLVLVVISVAGKYFGVIKRRMEPLVRMTSRA